MELLIIILTKCAVYICFLLALNSLMLGKTGLWAIGNMVYFSLGCYVTGFISATFKNEGMMYFTFIAVPVICILVSFFFYYASRFFKKDFFLFFSLFVLELNYILNKIVAGSGGYSNIIRPGILSSDLSVFIAAVVFLSILIPLIHLFDRSRKGQTLTIIRNNELLAESWGINIKASELPLFISSAVISGMAGILFAFCTCGSDPSTFTTSNVIILFTLVVFGGIDSIKGSVTAGLLYVLLTYFLESVLFRLSISSAPKIAQILFGIILIVSPLVMPEGLFGKRKFE